MSNTDDGLDRRDLLKAAALASATAAGLNLSASVVQANASSAAEKANPDLIKRENEKPGTTDWQLTRTMTNSGRYRTSLIEGYCSHQSVQAGEKLTVYVSTNPAKKFTIDFYRMGYYQGLGGRHLLKTEPLQGQIQPTPPMTAPPQRLRECQWEASYELTIPQDWVSGVYLGKLTTIPDSLDEPYWQSYVIFIVRSQRPADFLFQCSDNTWQAYNRWPVNESLYTHPNGAQAPDVAVSFDRPYGKYCQIFDHPLSIGSGEFLLWEFPLCFWMEQHGYDVSYCSNWDTMDSSFIKRHRTLLSVGHDEYWDDKQFFAVQDAINSGVNVLWLCGNSVFMVSPFTENAKGQPGRTITRTGSFGPIREDEDATYRSLFAGLKDAGPDERDIMGVRTVVPFNGGGDWTCTKADHWIFDKTGMKNGESIPGLVGWEHHGEPDPNRAGLEVVAEGKIWSGGTQPGDYAAVIFPGPKGNFVFNASTVFWVQGLASPPGHWIPWSHGSRPHGPDPRVQQITHNLFQKTLQQTTAQTS